jgi:hypothetical protein
MPYLIEDRAQRAVEISVICLIAQALAGLEIISGEREPRLIERAGRGRAPACRDAAAGLGLELVHTGQAGDQRAVRFEQRERGFVVAALDGAHCRRDCEHRINGRAVLRSLAARGDLLEPVEQREVVLGILTGAPLR